MNAFYSDVRNLASLLAAIFCVGFTVGAILVPLVVLLREVFAAKAADIRRMR
jgi:uncharacterized membrane protein YciS (DUF1049 family)